MARCTANTRAGTRCKRKALKGTRRCASHPQPDWVPAFLHALETEHLVTVAVKRAGVARSTVYARRASDEQFAIAWAEIEERSTELLEREAYRRAAVGTEKPVYRGGVEVGRIREFSDVLLIFLLKARRPNTYREHHKVELAGLDGAPIAAEITTVDARTAADASHEFLAKLAGPAA